jgi:hypothetical protein
LRRRANHRHKFTIAGILIESSRRETGRVLFSIRTAISISQSPSSGMTEPVVECRIHPVDGGISDCSTARADPTTPKLSDRVAALSAQDILK